MISTPYTKFAYFYDLLGWSEFTDLTLPLLLSFFDRLKNKPASYLDLACGTGTLAYKLTRKNITVSGVDISQEMIEMAISKSHNKQTDPHFFIEDISKFNLKQKFDCVGCFFDSINHLKSKAQIKKAFKCAYKHLTDQGWFVFDMITKIGFENWQDFYNSVDDQFYVVQEARYIPEKDYAQVKIEAFINDENLGTVHLKETFNEIYLPTDLLYDYLAEIGFSRIIIRPFPPADDLHEADRLMVYARK